MDTLASSSSSSTIRTRFARVGGIVLAGGVVASIALLGGSSAVAAAPDTVTVVASQVSETRAASGGWFYDNDPGTGAFAVTKDGPNNDVAMKLSLLRAGGDGTDKVYVYNSFGSTDRPTDIPALLSNATYTYAGVNVNFQIEVIFKPTNVAEYGPAGSTATCTPAATWWGWALTDEADWCYTVLKWEPFLSPGSTWVTVDLDQDVAASATNSTGGWIAQKRVGSIAPPGTFNGQKMSDILAQMAEYEVTGFVFGAGSGTPGPVSGWVKDYTIGGTTYQFAAEASAAAAPPAVDSDALQTLIDGSPADYPDTTSGFSVAGAPSSGTDTAQLGSDAPLNASLNWLDPTDSFVDVYAYSTPTFLGTFPVVNGKVILSGVDLSALEAGTHKLVFIGQTSGSAQVVNVWMAALAVTGARDMTPIAFLASTMLFMGGFIVMLARRQRRVHTLRN